MKKHIASWSMVLLLLVLAACSGGENTASTGEANKEENSKTEEQQETVAETRTVEHLYGEAEVPMNPEKIVLLSHVSWEGSLVSVGVKPHAVMAYDNEFPPHLTEELEGVTALPYADEIDPEEIVKLNPD